jgi:hypothetical protein
MPNEVLEPAQDFIFSFVRRINVWSKLKGTANSQHLIAVRLLSGKFNNLQEFIMCDELPDWDLSEFSEPDEEIPWNAAERDAFYEKLLAHYDKEEDVKEPDEIYCPYDEDLLAHWSDLRRSGSDVVDMITEGHIDMDTYPFFDEENDTPKIPVEPFCYTKRTLEELLSMESIEF